MAARVSGGESFRGDFAGGAASAVISLPISMTIGVAAFAPLGNAYVVYGVLAGVYGAIISGLAPLLFGGRSRLISGPRATSALILASLIAQLVASDVLSFPPGQIVPNVIAIAFFAMFLAGLFQLAGGITGFGNIVRHIPQPVIAGFVNSAALLMILAQCWTLLGIPRQDSFVELFTHLNETRPLTIVPGLAAGIAMAAASRWLRRLPGALAGLVVGTAVFYGLKNAIPGVDLGLVLGPVTTRFPTPELANMFTALTAGGNIAAVFSLVVPAALAIAVLASFETLFAQSALDDLRETRSDAGRELAWHGGGNMVTALLGGLIGAGGMVRTRPGYDAGGRTYRMGVWAGLIMLAAVVGLTDFIQYIPRAVISGMILVLGLQIFDRWSLSLLRGLFTGAASRRRASLSDALIVLLVMVVAMTSDLIAAVGVGTALAGIVFVSRMSGSVVRRKYRGPAIHSRSYWDEKRQAVLDSNGRTIAVLELDGVIFFGTADNLDREVHELQLDGVTRVVLDMKRVRDIDSTGAHALMRIKRRLENAGGLLAFSYVTREFGGGPGIATNGSGRPGSRRDLSAVLSNSEMTGVLNERSFFPDTDEALAFCEGDLIDQSLKGADWSRAAMSGKGAIFHGLSFGEIRLVRRECERCRFASGETVFRQGDAGNGLYYVARGRVAVYVALQERSEEKRLQTILPGGVFGEMALLDDGPRAASVVAGTESTCYRLDANSFELIKKSHPEIAIKLLNNISNSFSTRLRSANTMITELEQ